jgi:iron complex transport system permease protein
MMPTRRITIGLLLLLAPAVFVLCLLLGPSMLGWPDWTSESGRAIMALRFSRVLSGYLVGAGLSCAGVLFQALLRNPLAEPYILGVSSGAGLGAALAILTGWAAWNVLALPAAAFVLALLTLVIVYSLASHGGPPSVYGLILSGVIVSSVCSSVLMFLVAVAPVEGLHSVVWWMLGNLDVSARLVGIGSGSLILGGSLVIWTLAPELNALTLGQDIAHYVGVRTRLAVALGLGMATLVTAAAVALAGLIGFVGLIVPHAVRALVGPDHRRLVPAAALGGGMFLAACDAIARTILAPREIPVGVVTALIGGPFFLAILRKRKKSGWIG